MEEPLQLIEFGKASGDGEIGEIRLDEDNLARVLDRTENRPLCVICVSGPSRQGKSFLLGYMIRCLEALEQDQTDWMDWENKDKPVRGFKFRNGTTPETQGIWIWSKPFLITVGSEDTEIAVLLVDTQGTYDEFIDARTTASIVGISLLMSSCFIFNFFKNLQEDVLTSLDSYISYGKLALQDQDDEDSKVFQKLTFLIRDWNNPGEYAYGAKGGKGFLDEKLTLKTGQSPEAQEVRKSLKACFQSLDCFLMPYPGDTAIAPEFKGSIQELNPQFARKLEDFVSNLINPDDLAETSVKSVFGNLVTAKEFPGYLKTYLSVFNNKETPSPVSLLEATIQVTNQAVLDKCLKKFQDVLKAQQRSKQYLNAAALTSSERKATKEAKSLFKSAKKFGNDEKLEELEEQLEKLMKQTWKQVQKENQEKREKFIGAEMSTAVQGFNEAMEEFEFEDEHPLDYYEEGKLSKAGKSAMEDVIDEFKEKLDDMEEEEQIDEYEKQLKNRLSEILNSKILVNKNRRLAAEKEYHKMMETLADEYGQELKQIMENDPFGDLGSAQDKVKAEYLKKYSQEKRAFAPKDKKEPDFHGNFEDKLSQLFSSLQTAHALKGQERLQAADKFTQELISLYENDMEAAFLSDVSELQSWHNENFTQFMEMFEHECKLPKSTSVFLDSKEKLMKKLDEIYESNAVALEQKGLAAKQQLESALDETIEWYEKQMKKVMADQPHQSIEEFKATHTKFVMEAQKMFKDYPIPTVEFQDAGLGILLEKLSLEFDHLAVLQNQNRELVRIQTENLVVDCHTHYQDEMKVRMDQAKTEDEFKESHNEKNAESVNMFRDKCSVKDAVFIAPFIEELIDCNNEAFEEALELFELKMNEEMTATGGLIVDGREKFNEEMAKHFKNQEFIRPNDLDKLLEEVGKQVIEHLNKQQPLTQNQRNQLLETFRECHTQWKEQNDMNLEGEEVAIGIDLGTTYSCVAVYANGKVHVLPNKQGKKTTPSYVAFQPDGSEIVGEEAKTRAYENPENTIFDAKRIIGRKITEEKLQGDMKLWAFTVVDDGGVPKIQVGGQKLHPEQISAKVLRELKDDAEKFLCRDVKKAVITVPAYFTDGQRQATRDAGILAGLDVLQVLTEPVAAALAYKKQHADTFGGDGGQTRNTLIFDLGGGTFDVAVLRNQQGRLETLAVAGDDHLGGEDFDKQLMEYCAKEFQRSTGIDLFEGKESTMKQTRDDARRRLKRLQLECERKKIELTSARQATVTVDTMVGRTDLKVTVTRDKFEELNMPAFNITLKEVDQALADAKLSKSQIHDIVLVGGSTRIPKIQEMLKSYFGGKALDMSINPDEAVAYGAAMQAAMMNGAITRENTDFTKIQDVTPMSIGVEVYGGGFSVIIPRGTKIPVKAQERYKTAHNNQTSVQVTIFQGEELGRAVDNKHLGDFYLNGIPPKDAEVEQIDVEMIINSQGILNINAVCSSTGTSTGIRVTENKQRMGRATIQKLLAEASSAG